ncbi:MAG: ribonuclease R [Bacteroidota bacterium]
MPRPLNRAALKRDLLALLRNNGTQAFRPKELAKYLSLGKGREPFRLFRDVLSELEEAGLVQKVKGNRYQHRRQRKGAFAEGTLTMHPSGYGFVNLDRTDADDDLFVRANRLKNALHGDRVRVALAAPVRGRQDRKQEAEVVEVLRRGRTHTVGTFDKMGHFAFVKADDPKQTKDIYVPKEHFNGAEQGDKVMVSIDHYEDPKGSPEGRILSVLGRPDDPGVAVLSVALAQGIRSEFPPAVEAEAEAIPVAIPKKEIARRLDLRNAMIFTIDPEDAKDFDDAISIERLDSGDFRLGVHIADVSHYVEENTELDREAYERGTSTYLVDRVIPMLPERLSNGVCSLRPHEDKLTYSCLMTVSARGKIRDWEIRETVIHSKARLTYEEAQQILDGGIQEHQVKDEVLLAGKLARTLTRKRLREGSIDFDTPEVRIILNEAGTPIDIVRKERIEANRLIEECMLLANRCVSMEIGKVSKSKRKPFVYRIHATPDTERILALARYVKAFGYRLLVTDGTVTRKDLNDLLEHVRGTAEAAVIKVEALRSMSKAVYSTENIGHYGLGFDFYSHFTSPIRRFPDLIAHRLLKRYLAGGSAVEEEGLQIACRHLSDQERVAVDAERESKKLKQVEYAAQHLGEEYDGVVMGVTKFGVFVEIQDLLVEGLVHVRDMDDYFEYDPENYRLVGQHTRTVYRMGDSVRVKIAAADVASRKIDLVFAG